MWKRRKQPNVILIHYADLILDLPTEMRRVADGLGLGVPDRRLQELAQAATLDSMRARSNVLAPDPAGVLEDRAAFLRSGGSGSGVDSATRADVDSYYVRASATAPPDLLDWLHR